MTTIALNTQVAAPRADTPKLDPIKVARALINENGGARRPDLGAIKRALDAVSLQNTVLGRQVRVEVERLLTPVQRGELARATYSVGGVIVDPNARTASEQFRAPAGSTDRQNYAKLDRMFGDGDLRTDDSARITRAIGDLTMSGLTLEQLATKHQASETGWTAAAGDLIAGVSIGGHLAEAARPAVAALARDAGLGSTQWGAALQRVLDHPGTMRAFHAGAAQGFVEGGKDFIVTIASLAGRAIQYGQDRSPTGLIGDKLREVAPQEVKDWLRSVGAADLIDVAVPSWKRGESANAALAEKGAAIGRYLATHSPQQIAEDVRARIGATWDGIKKDHAAAVAKGPEAEARWWGRIVGRATFEVASTFVPVAGVVGKASKVTKGVDVAADALNIVDKTADAAKGAEIATDAAKVGNTVSAAETTTDAAKVVEAADKTEGAASVGRAVLTFEEIAAKLRSAATAELQALRAAGMGNKKIGPVVSVVMDRSTGTMSRVYINNAAGDLPPALNRALADRLGGARALDYIKTAGAGSHAEIYAVNELLNRGAKLENLVVYTEQVGGRMAGGVKPPCPHCAHLLEGVTYVR